MVKKDLNNKKQAIIKFLKKRYSAEVIIFVGSRAVGDYKKNSDWDVYLFTHKALPKETPDEFERALPKILKGEDIDEYKYDFNVANYSLELWKDLRNSVVVLDTIDSFGEKLRKKAQELYKKGPNKWTATYAQGRVYKARRYMKKFKDNYDDKNYVELFLRFSWHYSENIINWWFGIRREFPLRPQQAFPYIKKKDPKFYRELVKIVSDKTDYKTKIVAFNRCHKILFNKPEFKKLAKGR